MKFALYYFSLADISDEILKILMSLVYELLCHGQMMLGKLLRIKVLGKYEHRKSSLNAPFITPIIPITDNAK